MNRNMMILGTLVTLLTAGMAWGDLMIEGEDAGEWQNAQEWTIPTASNGKIALMYDNGGAQPACAYYYINSGDITPGNYNLLLTLYGDGSSRPASAELREGYHLSSSETWDSPSGYACPLMSISTPGFYTITCTDEIYWGTTTPTGDPTVYSFVSGTDYTLRICGYGGDIAQLDYLTFSEVPEPTTLALVALGGLGLIRRRGK